MAVQMIWHSVSVAPRGIGRRGERAWTRAVGVRRGQLCLVPRAVERVSEEYLGMVVGRIGEGAVGGRGRRRCGRRKGKAGRRWGNCEGGDVDDGSSTVDRGALNGAVAARRGCTKIANREGSAGQEWRGRGDRGWWERRRAGGDGDRAAASMSTGEAMEVPENGL
eukprot:scaffold706_cov106-Amphora_coffeaeformis.AAC.1